MWSVSSAFLCRQQIGSIRYVFTIVNHIYNCNLYVYILAPENSNFLEFETLTHESNSSTETEYSNSIDSPSPRPDIDLDILEQSNAVRMAIEGSTDCDRKDDHNKIEQRTLKTPIEHLDSSQSVDRLGKHLLFYKKLTYNMFSIFTKPSQVVVHLLVIMIHVLLM